MTPKCSTGSPQFEYSKSKTESCHHTDSNSTTPTGTQPTTDDHPFTHNCSVRRSTKTLPTIRHSPALSPPPQSAPRRIELLHGKKRRHIGKDTNLRVPFHADVTSTRNLHDSTTHKTRVIELHSQEDKITQKNSIDTSHTGCNSGGSSESEILLSEDQSKPTYASISDRPPLPLPDFRKESGLSISDPSLEFSTSPKKGSALSVSSSSLEFPTPVTSIRQHHLLPWWSRSLKHGRAHQLETSSGRTHQLLETSSGHYVNEGMGPTNTNVNTNLRNSPNTVKVTTKLVS